MDFVKDLKIEIFIQHEMIGRIKQTLQIDDLLIHHFIGLIFEKNFLSSGLFH